MQDEKRDELVCELSGLLDVDHDTIGRVLDEAAALEVDLTDWAHYEWQPVGRISWSWHPPLLYHGGRAGLRVGQLLLPPAITGVKPANEYADYPPGVYRPDRVYLTTDPENARLFAALHPSGTADRGGDVYRVEPLHGLERDHDCKIRGMSYQAPQARIVAIAATSVRRAPYTKAIAELQQASKAKGEPRRRLHPRAPGPR